MSQSSSRVALVTGASSGIGAETAQALLQDGYVVYVAARRIDRMQELVDAGAIALALDITEESQIQAAVDQIERDHGGVDVLVNNAGFGSFGAMEDTSLDEARYQFEVNLFGLGRLTQLLLPSMRAKRAGTIINISSMAGRLHMPLGSWYHATKHALEGWSDCLRFELKEFGIDVVVIEPGAIRTEFGNVMVDGLMKRSGSSAYAPMANRMKDATERAYEKGRRSSPPSVIVKQIMKAVRARKPRTRYVAGAYAKPMLFIRKWVGDRTFDWVLSRQL